MFSYTSRILVALVSLSISCPASAAVILNSSFDTEAEGWSVGLFFSPGLLSGVKYHASGGPSGGFIETTDVNTNNAFRAPSDWLGNQSALFGGVLRFQQRAIDTDRLVAPAVVLSSGSTRLQYRAAPPGTDWTPYSVALRSGEWEVGDGSGGPGSRLATNAEILMVLSNLEWFAFSGDWKAGEDLVGLDEVSVTTMMADAPEPAAMTSAAGLGTIALALLHRRRRT